MKDERTDPLLWHDIAIESDWIDYNGHLNMAFYLVIFDRAIDRLIRAVGLSDRPDDGDTIFAVEASLRYRAEIHEHDTVHCRTRVLFVDDKRLLTWQELIHADGRIAATCENLHLHVDRKAPQARVWRFTNDVRMRLEAMIEEAPLPDGAGTPVGARLRR